MMIVLDTNVISEMMRINPDVGVVEWLDAQPAESIWTTSVCVFEILYGLNTLPDGKRKQALFDTFRFALDQDIEGRVLNFDVVAATEAAAIASHLKTLGLPVDMRDLQIAGIVAARRGVLATRNLRDFVNTGISLVNPWDAHR